MNHPILASLAAFSVLFATVQCFCLRADALQAIHATAHQEHTCCQKHQHQAPAKSDSCPHCDQTLTITAPDHSGTTLPQMLVAWIDVTPLAPLASEGVLAAPDRIQTLFNSPASSLLSLHCALNT